jgi:hypothetical protein
MDFVVECKGCGSRVIRRGVEDTRMRSIHDEGPLMGRIYIQPAAPKTCENCRPYGLKRVAVPGYDGPPLLTSEKQLRKMLALGAKVTFDEALDVATKQCVNEWRKVLWRDAPGLPPNPTMPRLGEFVGE